MISSTDARALLKERGSDPDDLSKKKDGSVTPMINFCLMGTLPMVRYLVLCCSVDCRTSDARGYSPMHWAAMSGSVECIKFLCHDGGTHEDIQKLTVCVRRFPSAGRFRLWSFSRLVLVHSERSVLITP